VPDNQGGIQGIFGPNPANGGIYEGDSLLITDMPASILTSIEEASSIATLSTLQPITGLMTKMPVQNVRPQANFIGSSTSLVQTTSAKFIDKYLYVADIGSTVVTPTTYQADVNYDYLTLVGTQFGTAVGNKIDSAVLSGIDIPTDWNLGRSLTQDITAAQNEMTVPLNVAADQEFADMGQGINLAASTIAALGYRANATLTGPGFVSGVQAYRTSQGLPIYPMNTVAQGPGGFAGLDLLENANGAFPPAYSAIVGDWTNSIYGVRSDMEITLSNQATITDTAGNSVNLFQTRQIALMAVMRVAWVRACPVSPIAAALGLHDPVPFVGILAGEGTTATLAPGQGDADPTGARYPLV
jgi:HK97 family phage major capsid protein